MIIECCKKRLIFHDAWHFFHNFIVIEYLNKSISVILKVGNKKQKNYYNENIF
jgi:hypothetical protein